MIYRVRHETRYGYSKPVDLAAHLLHLRPRPLASQTIVQETLQINPEPSRLVDRLDHFGNLATWLFLDQPHATFDVISEFVTEVHPPPHPNPADTPPWEAVREAAQQAGPSAWDAAEFRFDSPLAPALGAASEYARSSFPAGRPILEALCDLNERMCRDFRFRAGVTTISTPIAQVMEQREGVCQDFTHVMLSALRGLGLPGRYTSGYVRTRTPPGQQARHGADQSHAWIGGWLGPKHGWLGLDPTNGVLVGDEHVIVALGRDFSDISPVRGMILGGGRHILRVAVDLEPLETQNV
jgi:transglutaminase-like putative cysteine protease